MKLTETHGHNQSLILIGFITLSIAVHGSLFLLQTNPDTSLTQVTLGSKTLYISLAGTDNKKQTQTTQELSENTPQKIIKPVARLATSIHLVDNIQKYSSTSEIKPDNVQKTAQQNFVLGEIQNRLSKYLSYPARAQRRGWQGEVLVGFHVDKQGFLHNIHLTQSSGYSLLDKATLNAIGKIKSIPLNLWFNKNLGIEFHPSSLQLPVIYQLTNS